MSTRSQSLGGGSKVTCSLVAAAVALLSAQPALAAAPAPAPQQQTPRLTGVVYDGSGLPLIGALIAVALPGSEQPEGLTISDRSGRFSIGLSPGTYTLLAQSFGHISAVIPEVNVPHVEPLRLQLRAQRQITSMLSDGAPLDIGYALYRGARDILRGTDVTVADPLPNAGWIRTLDEESMWGTDIGGELSLWTVAPLEGNVDDGRSATDFALGSVGSEHRQWVFRGQLGDGGVVRARSDISRVMSDAHAIRIGAGFAGKDLATPSDSEHALGRMWVGSVSAEDFWRLGEALQIGYGVRFEHYNYLDETALMSPRLQVAYAPIESVTFLTGISYDAEAPGLAELRFQVDPLAVRYMDVLAVDDIDPERTMRYEVGVETALADTEWRARAYHDSVRDELVGIYLASEDGPSEYLVANLGESVTQGFQLDVRRSIAGALSATASYAYAWRDGGALPTELAGDRGLFGDEGLDRESADVDAIHEIAAGVETIVGGYDTRLNATYHLKTGIPVVRSGNLESVYERLDVNLRQPLPFSAFSSDWSALVQVQNVLGRSYDGVFDFRLGDAPVLSRLVSGGLAVRF